MLEFALLAPIFFGILAAILQTSVVFLAGQFLESAVQDSSRMIRTGQADNANWTLGEFRGFLCDRLYSLVDCSRLHIEVDVLDTFSAAQVVPPIDPTCTSSCGWTRSEKWEPGAASSIVLVQVHYRFNLVLPYVQLTTEAYSDGEVLLGSALVFRNEPY